MWRLQTVFLRLLKRWSPSLTTKINLTLLHLPTCLYLEIMIEPTFPHLSPTIVEPVNNSPDNTCNPDPFISTGSQQRWHYSHRLKWKIYRHYKTISRQTNAKNILPYNHGCNKNNHRVRSWLPKPHYHSCWYKRYWTLFSWLLFFSISISGRNRIPKISILKNIDFFSSQALWCDGPLQIWTQR